MSQDPTEAGFPYSSIAIVGLGLIGGSLALSLRRAGFRGTILGVSRAASLNAAAGRGAIDEGFPYEKIVDAAARSDLIILSSPIRQITEHLTTLGRAGDRLRENCVVTDVGSTKREIVRSALDSLPEHVHFIGGHPLAGSESRGFSAADPLLFENSYYVLTTSPRSPEREVRRLAGMLASIGSRVVVMPAEQHDQVAAAISHLPQLLAVSLVNFLDDLEQNREHGIRLAAGGFRDMTRIASSPFSVWQDIIATNREEILRALKAFVRRLEADLGELEPSKLGSTFDRAAATRAEIPKDTKGFLSELWEVLVVVEDRPGTLAGMATRLSDEKINIKDIELLKVREGETSSFRLAFETREVAERAASVLEAAGFQVQLRD